MKEKEVKEEDDDDEEKEKRKEEGEIENKQIKTGIHFYIQVSA